MEDPCCTLGMGESKGRTGLTDVTKRYNTGNPSHQLIFQMDYKTN